MNNPWIVNQRRGVSSLDQSTALMGPRGLGWRETKQTSFHPLLVQIKIKALLKGSACAQVIWGPVERNPRENTSQSFIHVLTGRQIKNVSVSQTHPLHLYVLPGFIRWREEWVCHVTRCLLPLSILVLMRVRPWQPRKFCRLYQNKNTSRKTKTQGDMRTSVQISESLMNTFYITSHNTMESTMIHWGMISLRRSWRANLFLHKLLLINSPSCTKLVTLFTADH